MPTCTSFDLPCGGVDTTARDTPAAETRARDPRVHAPRVCEKPYRSMVKAISWRATGTLDTVVISWLITGELKWALSIGFVELFTKVGLYYLHERVWNRVPLGRVKPSPDHYEI